jgi:DMSO/TMAO reductase YedYZ molybdopterin-dependent catalytic subunit
MRQDVTGLWIDGVHCDRLTVTAADFGQCRRREQSDPRFRCAGTWSSIAQAVASAGGYGRSSTPGASATIYFRGTRLDWIAVKGHTPGVADVYLDGVKQATIDLAAPASTYQVNVWSTGTLPEGDHMVEIVRSSSSTPGEYLTLDAVDIWGTMRTGP